MRFKPGQQVVYAYKKTWVKQNGRGPSEGLTPVYNQVYTVDRYHAPGFIILRELGQYNSWQEAMFEPLMDITELTEILESQPAEV